MGEYIVQRVLWIVKGLYLEDKCQPATVDYITRGCKKGKRFLGYELQADWKNENRKNGGNGANLLVDVDRGMATCFCLCRRAASVFDPLESGVKSWGWRSWRRRDSGYFLDLVSIKVIATHAEQHLPFEPAGKCGAEACWEWEHFFYKRVNTVQKKCENRVCFGEFSHGGAIHVQKLTASRMVSVGYEGKLWMTPKLKARWCGFWTFPRNEIFRTFCVLIDSKWRGRSK